MKKLVLTFALSVFYVAQSMEENTRLTEKTSEEPFELEKLPLDTQRKIEIEAFIDSSIDKSGKLLTPEKFYKNLLRLKNTSKTFFNIIKYVLENKNLKSLYLSNNILNKKFPKSLTTQALIYAVKGNSPELTKLLLTLGANAKVWDPDTKTPIIESAKDKDIKNILLSYGAIENVPYNYYNDKEFIIAASRNNIKKVQNLINAGTNVNAVEKEGNTALIIAAIIGRTDIVKELINAGADLNLKENLVGNTALIAAARFGHLDIVKELIKAGADINAKTISEETALNLAADKGYTEIVKELIKAKAHVTKDDLDTPKFRGYTQLLTF